MADNDTKPTEEPQAQAPGTEGSEQGGFSEAFAERANPQEERQEEPSAKAGAEAPAKEEPAATAAGAEAPSKEAADASSGPKAAAFDPYAGLTPELKAHWEKVAASERSNRGRVGALTKKLNGMAVGTQAPPKAEPGANRERSDEGAGRTGTGDGEGKPEASDIEARLKAVTEEYGDIVGPVAEVVEDLRRQVSELTASATRHQVTEDAAAQTEALAELEKAHPDFRDYNEQNEKFVEWFKEQPAGVQALANSFDPKEVSLALRLFKAEGAVSSEAPTEEGKGGDGSTATGDRRERQMRGLEQPTDRAAPAVAGTPNDFKSGFAARAAQAR